jgi:hypothetical protein
MASDIRDLQPDALVYHHRMFQGWPTRLVTVISLAAAAVFIIGLVVTWSTREGQLSPLGVPMGADLLQHHTAARFAQNNQWDLVYPRSTRESPASGETVQKKFLYVYPPVVAWWGSLASGWGYLAWVAVWQIGIVATYGAIFLLLRPWRPGGGMDTVVALGLPVFYYGLILAQNSALSLLIIVGAAHCLRTSRPWLAGLVLSCFFFKPQIGLTAAGFLFLAGYWRTSVGFGLGSLAWLALALATCGVQPHADWLHILRGTAEGKYTQVTAVFQSLPGIAALLTLTDGPAWVRPLSNAVGLILLSLLALGEQPHRRSDPTRGPVTLFFGMASWVLLSPYVMHYDLLLAAPWWVWNLRNDLAPGLPRKIRLGGIAAALSFWVAALLSINPADLPVTPAIPFLLLWFIWTVARNLRIPRSLTPGSVSPSPRTDPTPR